MAKRRRRAIGAALGLIVAALLVSGCGGAGDPVTLTFQLLDVVVLAAVFTGLSVRAWKRLEI